ncbi:MAG TPA: HlyD family efflux transporter periplasmic adaptor subunit, partial [Burkholderiaceae bacterium]|nr:HlyD family efflux transporter periplasmic adaptor subunit [Burkholderiaceae bacterium]
PLLADEETLNGVQEFLAQNFLLCAASPQASDRLASIAANRSKRDLRWLLHHYLFIRVPLLRPDCFLAATLPYISFIYTRAFAVALAMLTLTGLFLASRQWDIFLASVQDSFTPAGVVGYLLALCFAKILHELGHAYTATRYGVRVAHMGVSFIVLFPMLYTDTSESWKLTERRKRLAIVLAGMATEMGIAGIATLCWSLAGDGAWRSAFFFLATTSWILSLGINASPFLRFDGYFVLSDIMDMPNLHSRSFAFGRHFLRRRLLGFKDPLPEALPRSLSRFLTVFAFMVWAVRFMVFLGIAIGIYLYVFKALGIFLFAVEIWWFILMPFWSEVSVWWKRRNEIVTRARVMWLAVVLCALAYVFIPMQHGIGAPAWLRAQASQSMYAPFPARVTYVRGGGPVQKGDVLVALESPDIGLRHAVAQAASATTWTRLQRSDFVDDDLRQRALLGSRLRQEQAEARSAVQEVERLALTAPFSGVLTDLDPLLRAGVWVAPSQELGVLLGDEPWVVEAFVSQESVQHVGVGDKAKVYLARQFEPVPATVVGIDSARTQVLPDPMLDAAHGGSIRVSTVNDRQEVQHAVYRVRMALDHPLPLRRIETAHVVISGARYAIAAEWMRDLAGVLIRESGF